MTLAVKGLLVERGLDPRRFTLLCYGGCGPLFGAPIARALAIGRVVVPGLSAVFSAYGAATADVRREAVRTLFRPLPVELDALAAAFAALEAEVRQAMRTEGVDAAHVTLVPEVDLRFHRQTWEVTVPLAPLDRPTVEGLGDGDTSGDIQGAEIGTDDRSFFLRSERSGTGSGRIYTVTYRATDASLNATITAAQVTVRH